MPRKPKKQLEAEVAADASSTDDGQAEQDVFDQVDTSADLIDPTPHKEAAQKPLAEATRPTEEEIKAAAPKQYVVKRGGKIMHRGFMTDLHTGKVIKENSYNIPQLKQQGIELDEVKE